MKKVMFQYKEPQKTSVFRGFHAHIVPNIMIFNAFYGDIRSFRALPCNNQRFILDIKRYING